MPTQSQCYMAIFVCQLLSNLYQPIQVFRYDQKLKTIYIQYKTRCHLSKNWVFKIRCKI
ncbi:hypothetical protein ACE1CI_34740 [Aerosakkonemataceae cyanobacterium BLCC-F50]|uniref:DUF6888 domain-containing protein n=1 Tax=Floridaenema flaviceps BLCC-F50 TaxID=3153642 RepID=A0ABV4Y2E8_9CYAN